MELAVAYLVGRFPEPSERPVLQEIIACRAAGARARIVAFHPSGSDLPADLAVLGDDTVYLDPQREQGAVSSAMAGLRVGIGYALHSPCLACSSIEWPTRSGVALYFRRARLDEVLERERPDIVHAQFGHLAMAFLPVVQARRIPLIVSFRGQDVMLVRRARARKRQALFDVAARVLARSDDMRADLLPLGCPSEKLAVVPTGVDSASIPFSERTWPGRRKDVVILIAGRLAPKKGVDDALRAVALLDRSGGVPRVRIAGDGSERARLEKLAAELGLNERVSFLGWQSYDALIREMASAHLFLLPCKTAVDGEKEGIPNAIKEAQAAGLPVVSTRHAGIAECVADGAAGLLAPEGDVEAIAAHVERLLGESERWPKMGRRGRERIEAAYALESVVEQLLAIYRHAAAEKKKEQM